MNGQLKIFSGNANPELAKKIAKFLKAPLGDALVTTFSEGEVRVKINEDVRGRDVFRIVGGRVVAAQFGPSLRL